MPAVANPANDDLATWCAAVEAIEAVEAPRRAVFIVWDPLDPPEVHTLLSDASAADLQPLLRAVLARLERGETRMPVDGGVRWVDVEES
jgi:hypothetical protein